MEDSFSQWRDSSNRDDETFFISDSEEDTENAVKEIDKRAFVVDESNDEDSDILEHATPKRSMINDSSTPFSSVKKNKTRKMKKNKIIDSDSTDDGNNEAKRCTVKMLTDDSCNITDDSDKDYSADEDCDVSIPSSSVKCKNKKRKDISHDYTKENIKELKHDSSSNESSKSLQMKFTKDNTNQQDINTDHKVSDDTDKTDDTDDTDDTDQSIKSVKVEASRDKIIMLDSDSGSEKNSETESLAVSLAKQEIGVGSDDPLIAQKRELILCKIQDLNYNISRTKMIIENLQGNVKILPDKGKRLYDDIEQKEKEIKELTLELESLPVVQNLEKTEATNELQKEKELFMEDKKSYLGVNSLTSEELKQWGKRAQDTKNKEFALTIEGIQKLHGSLIARPSEQERTKDPKGLKVELMPHQQHALAWLLWREKQKPTGGVLADDMGLGKTLTMIALIMTTLAEDFGDSDDSDDEWQNEHRPLHHKGGTLIVCPASLLSQWENEVKKRCKRGIMSVEIYHGGNRENVPKRLAKNDMVITTYNILSREHSTNSTLYKINWKRVILDEAHVIRNHKSKASEAACALMTSKRWALTGTPIQNKELDLYSILKFLKCTPFDNLGVWKRWVDNKNVAGHQRLATIMKTLMLRRTKAELIAKGDLQSLPDKDIEEVMVELDPQEQLVYEKILVYSRTLFAQFLAQRAEKDHMNDLYGGKYNKPTFLSNPNKETQFTKAQKKLLATHADVKTHEILVLLLRLRQMCCHPALIQAMLDQEDVKQNGMIEMENMDPDIFSRMKNLSLHEIENPEEENVDIDQRITENLLTSENPIFDNNRVCSKMKKLLDLVKKILQKDNDKLIIISQWATLLDIIALHLSSIKGATFSKFTGSVAVKDRQEILETFNNPNSGPRILLLSLTAGGVGLNLVGANHLLLYDIHWNPQLETQAQDRIYRFGQTKNVHIYKFICSNTIEERIKALQERKIAIAQNVLSGNTTNEGSKLTFNDLKSLFAL